MGVALSFREHGDTRYGTAATHLVRVSEPRGALLFATDQCDPIATTVAEPFPDVRVAFHPPGFLGAFERASGGRADPMCETLVVPKGGILQDQPASRFADPTPAFPLVSVAANILGRIQITLEPKLLSTREVRLVDIHVLGRRRELIFLERPEEIGRARRSCEMMLVVNLSSVAALKDVDDLGGAMRRRASGFTCWVLRRRGEKKRARIIRDSWQSGRLRLAEQIKINVAHRG